jgi:hypothetical protein
VSDGLGPLPLLAYAWPLRDLLILGYNANLGFFERAGLAKARSRGARVTLISDADMVLADSEATRFAGRAYLDARAIGLGGGAFHPKLVVALGQERAEILIGSGNTSPGGWISNAELWTLLKATSDGAPSTLARVADFLDGFVPLARLTSGAAKVIEDVVKALRGFEATEAGPLLVSSVFGPIIDQLPEVAPVSELVLSAPFFDRKAEAVSRLIDHFDPDRLELVVGEDANFDGAELGPLVADRGGTVSKIAGRRYHHGKLVEWVSHGVRSALIGSPNLSRSALLESMADGGNCELGLVADLTTSLRPETAEELAHAAVTNHQWNPAVTGSTMVKVQLLDVLLEGRGLRLDLRSPLSEPAKLQYHDGATWETFADVPAGELNPVVPVVIHGGKQVRLLFADGTPSRSRGVTDLERTNFRHVAAKRQIPGRPTEFDLDPRFVTMIEQALMSVRAMSSDHPPAVRNPTLSYAHTSTEGWREYIDGFRAEVGDDFGFFILPSIMSSVGVEAPEQPPAEVQDLVEVGGDESVDEEDLVAAEATARINEQDEKQRHVARYRSMAQRLAKEAPNRPDVVRIASAVLTAGGVALNCWPRGPELAERLRTSLDPLLRDDLQPEFLRDAASITAVTLALMRSQVRHLSDGSLAAIIYRRTADDAAPLLAFAERDDVAYRCAGFVAQGLIQLTDVDFVMDLVDAALHPDPISAAVDELGDDGIAAEAVGRNIEILGRLSNAVGAALRAVAIAQDGSPVGARARDAKSEVVAIWVEPHLVVAQRTGSRVLVSRYPLPWLLPSGYLHNRQSDPSPAGTQRLPGPLPVEEVQAAFDAVGLDFADF